MLMSDKYYNYHSILKKLGTPLFKLATHGPEVPYRIPFQTQDFMTSGQEIEMTKVYFIVFKPCRLFY